MALDLLVLWVAITNWMSAHLLAKRGVVNLGRSPEGGALVGMQVPCRHERSRRTEHSDGTLSHHQLVPVVGPPNLPARGTYPHLLTPGGLGRSALLRARRQHPDRDRRIGPGDPLPVEGWHRIDRAGRVPRTRARDHRRRDRRGVGLRFLCLAGCSVLEPNSSNQCLRPSAGWLHCRGSGVLGCDRKPQSVCAARGSRHMGVLDLCCGHRERILRRLPPSPQPPFNQAPVVVFLSVIGLVTSVFFVSRDVYGTIAFHNFLGILGVVRALDASGKLSAFERPIIPLLVMAVVAIALLIATHVLWLSSGTAPTPPRVR